MNRSPTTRGITSFTMWTNEKCQELAALWTDGWSASEIGAQMGCTRMAVLGKAHRMKLPRRREGVNYGAAKRRSAANPPRPKPARVPRSNLSSRISKREAKRPPAPKPVAAPVQAVSDADLVAGWLAQNGGPRRFNRGESGDLNALQIWLRDRGYSMSQRRHGGVFLRDEYGRRQRMTAKELIEFVDELREAEGLERIAA